MDARCLTHFLEMGSLDPPVLRAQVKRVLGQKDFSILTYTKLIELTFSLMARGERKQMAVR